MRITVINTGGTFNKVYNTISGQLDVKGDANALKKIIQHCHNIEFDIKNIIAKDSLEMNSVDRHLILQTIKESKSDSIIVVHGTDTMDETAAFIAMHCEDKKVVFTGAMTPMSIDEVEATINFSQAIGFLNVNVPYGVYISMHGVVNAYHKVIKNKEVGKFFKISEEEV